MCSAQALKSPDSCEGRHIGVSQCSRAAAVQPSHLRGVAQEGGDSKDVVLRVLLGEEGLRAWCARFEHHHVFVTANRPMPVRPRRIPPQFDNAARPGAFAGNRSLYAATTSQNSFHEVSVVPNRMSESGWSPFSSMIDWKLSPLHASDTGHLFIATP